MEMEQKDCSVRVDKLMEKHAWIASENSCLVKVEPIMIFLLVILVKQGKNSRSFRLNNLGVLL